MATVLLIFVIFILGIFLLSGLITTETPQANSETTKTVYQFTEVAKPQTKKEEPPQKVIEKETLSQKNAVKMARSYLSYTAFSRKGLIQQLEFEGFSITDATYGVDKINVDWREQAVKMARSYLSYTAFSRKGLIDQLVFEGFNISDATYGVDKIDYR